tara:strand:+ start:2229 stop:2873 length:645 start_codon:yes stop_codon:yes gene_type:complete
MAALSSGLRNADASSPIRCAILISGSGSGMEAMIRHQQDNPECNHSTVLVISDRNDAKGLARATSLGVEAVCIPLPTAPDSTARRTQHEALVVEALESKNIELVVLSGYMRLLTPLLIDRYAPNLLNIHPSLLPAFPGAHAHRDVLKANVAVSGCTVHRVDEGMDTGAILAQRRVPVFPGDDESSLGARVRIEEHTLYPDVVDALVNQSSNQGD